MSPADARARLHDARAKLAEAFVILEDVGPHLEEPERAAGLELRADVADAIRRVNALAAFLSFGDTRP